MDLGHLVGRGKDEGPSNSKTTNRQGLFKRTGTKSASDNRVLRAVQANSQRSNVRSAKINKGRNVVVEGGNDENRNAAPGTVAGRLSRRDRLEEYLKEKKAQQERLKAKSKVTPFRCGKYQPPVNTLAALPPVPGFKKTSSGYGKQATKKVDKTPVVRSTPAASSRCTLSQRNRKTPLDRSNKRLAAVKESQAKSTPKSFAPKNFKFGFNMPMPSQEAKSSSKKRQSKKVEEALDEEETPLNSTFDMEEPNENQASRTLNNTFDKEDVEKVEEAAKESPKAKPKRRSRRSSVIQAEQQEAPSTPTKEEEKTPPPRRRSRRISGVQPDVSLTPAQLSVTPARRAKERSLSRDRRMSQGCGMCTDTNCGSADHSAVVPAMASLDEPRKLPEVVLESPKIIVPSTIKRRRTRMSMMKVIEESQEEPEEPVMTPMTALTNKISNAKLDTTQETQEEEAGPSQFKTPKSTRIDRVKAASEKPMVVRSPLSSINKQRGASSKRKRNSLESKDSVAALFENLEGSPLLAKLEAKIISNEEITEDDFMSSHPPAKQLKLDADFDKIAAEEEQSSSNDDKKDQASEEKDVPYFRNLLKTETERLTLVCDSWEAKLEDNLSKIEDGVQGEIRSVVGQGRLVMAERFHQFSGLVDNCEFKRGEKETTTMDLMGFWEMIYFQVEDVDKKFKMLEAIEKNNWMEVVAKPAVQAKRKNVKSKPAVGAKSGKSAASSGLRAMIAAKRKAAAEAAEGKENTKEAKPKKTPRRSTRKSLAPTTPVVEVEKSFDGGFFKIDSPLADKVASKISTPSPRLLTPGLSKPSLRRSLLTDVTNRRSVSGALLSPFVSQAARRSMPSSPARSMSPSMVEDTKLPLTPGTKTYSKTSSPASAKQTQEDMFDSLLTVKQSPRVVRNKSIELMSFSSPDEDSGKTPVSVKTRRSSRVTTN